MIDVTQPELMTLTWNVKITTEDKSVLVTGVVADTDYPDFCVAEDQISDRHSGPDRNLHSIVSLHTTAHIPLCHRFDGRPDHLVSLLRIELC